MTNEGGLHGKASWGREGCREVALRVFIQLNFIKWEHIVKGKIYRVSTLHLLIIQVFT